MNPTHIHWSVSRTFIFWKVLGLNDMGPVAEACCYCKTLTRVTCQDAQAVVDTIDMRSI